MVALFCCIVFLGIGLVATDTETDGYSGTVKALFGDLTEYTAHLKIAKDKMNEFKDETWDRKYAIAIINLYTQPGQFYLTLNSEMKNGYPANIDIWRRAGNLINRAVDILGAKLYEVVYRGCQVLDELPLRGNPYNFGQIVSASQQKDTAVSFITCSNKFLFQMDKAYGAPVEKYSHYTQDKEVIIKSTHKFDVIDGPNNDGQYNVYFLSGQSTSEIVDDGNKNGAINSKSCSFSLINFTILMFTFLF